MCLRSSSLAVLGLVLVAVAVAMTADGRPSTPAGIPAPPEKKLCEPVTPTTMDGKAAQGRSVTMLTNDAIRFRVCSPQTLSFAATGTEAAGVYARLLVSENARQLVDTQVRGKKRFSVDLTAPGWVVIAFVNDLYAPPADRNLTVGPMSRRSAP